MAISSARFLHANIAQEVDEVEGDNIEKEEQSRPPPLPEEDVPPLPNEPVPEKPGQDDGWAPVWDEKAQAFYFYNRHSGLSQWTNPRVLEPVQPPPPGVDGYGQSATVSEAEETGVLKSTHGGYDPKIHGDYDPTASYAMEAQESALAAEAAARAVDPLSEYGATGAFNRFTGRWQALEVTPELHNDENKAKRQMGAYFDVDAAANIHNGKSLRAERSGKKLTKTELKAFKEKRKEKKEEKRRAWLKD